MLQQLQPTRVSLTRSEHTHTPAPSAEEGPDCHSPPLSWADCRSPGAAQQRVASRRREQGPHWFNISFSFQSIVPI